MEGVEVKVGKEGGKRREDEVREGGRGYLCCDSQGVLVFYLFGQRREGGMLIT